jgi:hypothetical protein
MNPQTVQLIDPKRNVVATANVAEKEALFAGHVDLASMPARLLRLFEEFEQIVNEQVLSLLDKIEDKISSAGLQAVFPGGQEVSIRDLQIYPSTSRISFRQAGSSVDGKMNRSGMRERRK